MDQKLSLASWDKCCMLVDRGGLGAGQLHFQNKAFLIKLCTSFINNTNDFWVRVLRPKYKVGNDMHNNCSFVWRPLEGVLSDLRENTAWKVGNGRDVCFLTDSWFKDLGPLLNYCKKQRPSFSEASVFAMISLVGKWNWSYFIGELLMEIIYLFVKPRLQLVDAKKDIYYVWKATDLGTYIVARGYKTLKEELWTAVNAKWKRIWKLKFSQRIRQFLWMCLHGRLLTNVERCRKGLTDVGLCLICGHVMENIDHVLRTCPVAQIVWKRLVPFNLHYELFTMNVEEWLLHNILNVKKLSVYGIHWELIFTSTIWREIWLFSISRI